jgi:cytoskeleton protein RodZ
MSDAERLGEELRKAREARDLSLEKAEQQTRIRVKFLEAMEQGNYAALPSPVHARGFLRNYARYLGLDSDDIIERYDAMQSGRRRRPKKHEEPTLLSTEQRTIPRRLTEEEAVLMSDVTPQERGVGETVRRNPLMILGFGVVGLAIIGVISLVAIIGLQALSERNNSGIILSPLPPSPTGQLTQAPAETSTPHKPSPLPPPKSSANTPIPVTGTVAPDNVALSLQIVQRTWLRVIVDEVVQFTGSVPPGTTLQYQGKKINVRIENGAGVRAIVNGQDIGILGARGQIVDQTFTPGNIIQATIPPPSPGTAAPSATAVSYTSPSATFSFTGTATKARPTVVATLPPTSTHTSTPHPSATPTITVTPSKTRTLTATPIPSVTLTPSHTLTPTQTPTVTSTMLILPHETSTPQGGEIRPKN